jgi:general secretion pathway protein G
MNNHHGIFNRRLANGRRWVNHPASRTGFTLVELMAVITIMALLAGIVGLSVRSYTVRSKQNIAKIEIGKLIQALDTFFTTYDRYPSNEEGLEILATPSAEFAEGLLPYVPDDPWGQRYEYRNPGESEPFEIVCFGADKRQGGEGGDRDITSQDVNTGK